MWTTHLHHGVPGAVVSQLLQPGDEALAGLTVDAARLHHGLALLHELDDSDFTGSIKTLIEIFEVQKKVAREQKPGQTQMEHFHPEIVL